jgi:hypothetical protein
MWVKEVQRKEKNDKEMSLHPKNNQLTTTKPSVVFVGIVNEWKITITPPFCMSFMNSKTICRDDRFIYK